MLSRLQQLWQFRGGLHLDEYKQSSTTAPIQTIPLPAKLILPLQQHLGHTAEAIVKKGDKVLKGQKIAEATGYVSVPLHAPTSGTIIDIGDYPVAHPSAMKSSCIVIEPDGQDQWAEKQTISDYKTLTPEQIREIVSEAGIVGMGGAGFPSFIKLNPGEEKKVKTLILNGAECEPYITCDDMLMREQAKNIIAGARIMLYSLQAERCLIGIEDNKPEAISAIQNAASAFSDITVVAVPTLYPTGGEKQLIKVLTGLEVPSQSLPGSIGIVCHNVATANAVYHAVILGEPSVSRIVTVAGDKVKTPRNLEVLIGTPFNDLINACDGLTDENTPLIMGGPMMGFRVHSSEAPVIKTCNCILAKEDQSHHEQHMPCIRCAKCAEACPVNLLPQQLYWYARAKDFDKAQDYKLFDCIECGCCDYVCPSHIPLVQYYRFAKTEIWVQEQDKQKSDIARERHEFRQLRLEREKRERAERHKQKQEALNKSGDKDKKQEAIQAALDRVKAKRESQQENKNQES
ncbi:MAG: electron transport complex subunit RsxC [Gammaproteobacteria bacterium]|nr:electron transport complex subunit RsxC [Gammaproteobacteria bacterium]MDH5592786.1 electron transport complex subunit RsxC [Gammaproteobacteria bacterium]